ncbi:MAG: hypothetical protein JSV88_00400 [Candidatus Aminicenantes bacterium]|nr:MAG: hypothetical protein JSV88_00400 [Candidatus Aminicenantes bacterium]
MNKAIVNLLESYDLKTQDDYEIALKEIVQHLALLGLWRSKFYEHASLYGGCRIRACPPHQSTTRITSGNRR